MKRLLNVGTRSVLYGAHQFLIHPIIVFIAWWKIYGFPKDPRLWVAFIVHDWGYWGKPNMDGEEGETHVELGARIMGRLFDKRAKMVTLPRNRVYCTKPTFDWYDFTLYHSRFYAKKNNAQISRLCVADKYAIVIEPWWLYLPRVILSGEIKEYMKISGEREGEIFSTDKVQWCKDVKDYLNSWVCEHKDNLNDNWTNIN